MHKTITPKIISAVNIEEVVKLAKNFKFETSETEILEFLLEECFQNKNHVIKFAAFFKELVESKILKSISLDERFGKDQFKTSKTKSWKDLKAFKNDELAWKIAIYSFYGHCYNRDLLKPNFPLNALKTFNTSQHDKIVILNFWLMISEKFGEVIKTMNEKTLQQVIEETEKIKKSQNGFGKEIFEDFEKIFKECLQKFKFNSQEFKIIDEILNFPNLEANQSKLDTIFLINLHKIDLQISPKIFQHLKEIEKRHKIDCFNNLFDLRNIDDSKVDKSFKEVIEKIEKEEKEFQIIEIVWFDRQTIRLYEENVKIDINTNHIKFFMSKLILDDFIEDYAEFLINLQEKDKKSKNFVAAIVDFCTKIMTSCEELLEFKILTEKQFFKIATFSGELYKNNLINLIRISKIVNDLEEQNLGKFLKYLSFEISQKFLREMKDEILKNKSMVEIMKKIEQKENLKHLLFTNYQNLLKTKQIITKYTKNSTPISNYLDKLEDNFTRPVLFDPKKVIKKSLNDLVTAIVKRTLIKPNFQNTISLLDSLKATYKKFRVVFYDVVKSEIENIFNFSTGDKVNWIEVKNMSELLAEIQVSFEELLENSKVVKLTVILTNKIAQNTENDAQLDIVSEQVQNMLSEIEEHYSEAYRNILKQFENLHKKRKLTKLPELIQIMIDVQKLNPNKSPNDPKYKEVNDEEVFREQENSKIHLSIFKHLNIKNAEASAQQFFYNWILQRFDTANFTDFIEIWTNRKLEGENAKFLPEIVILCRKEFHSQHMEQKGHLKKIETIKTAVFVRDLYQNKVITLEEFREYILIILHSIALNASFLNIRCFYAMVMLAIDEIEDLLEPELSFIISMTSNMLHDRTERNIYQMLTSTDDDDDESETEFDKYLENFENNGKNTKFNDFCLNGIKIDSKFAEKILMTVKKMKNFHFEVLMKILKAHGQQILNSIEFFMLEQIAFELYLIQRKNYNWKAIKNLTMFACEIYDFGLFQFDEILDKYLTYIDSITEPKVHTEALKNFKSKKLPKSHKKKVNDSQKKFTAEEFELKKKFAEILFEILKTLKNRRNFEPFYKYIWLLMNISNLPNCPDDLKKITENIRKYVGKSDEDFLFYFLNKEL